MYTDFRCCPDIRCRVMKTSSFYPVCSLRVLTGTVYVHVAMVFWFCWCRTSSASLEDSDVTFERPCVTPSDLGIESKRRRLCLREKKKIRKTLFFQIRICFFGPGWIFLFICRFQAENILVTILISWHMTFRFIDFDGVEVILEPTCRY